VVDSIGIICQSFRNFQRTLHVFDCGMEMVKQIHPILIERFVKPGAVDAVQPLDALRGGGLAPTKEAFENGWAVRCGEQFIRWGRCHDSLSSAGNEIASALPIRNPIIPRAAFRRQPYT
jgi:hypothetical protein